MRGGHGAASLERASERPDGADHRTGQHGAGLEGGESQPRRPRRRWDDDRPIPGLHPPPLAADSATTPRWLLPTATGPQEGHPEIGRQRRADARHPDRAGSRDPAGRPPSPDTDLRPHLFGVEFRLSAPTIRPRSGQAGQTLHQARLSHGRRYGPLEVLRPGPTRCPDEPSGSPDRRQATAAPDRALPAGGRDGRRSCPIDRG